MKRKTMVSVLFMEFSIIFTVCLIASNILETKQMVFGPLYLTGGLLIFPLAFYGVLPDEELPLMMLSQLVLKTVYEVIVLPVTIRVVRWVKAYEGEDIYDHGVSYNIFAVFKKSDGKD